MKFVCTECDEPMKFDQNGGLDEDGSMSATFRCPSCEWGVTLLINPQETHMVRSLGVKIGGATVPAQPMEMLQTHLANPSESATDGRPARPAMVIPDRAAIAVLGRSVPVCGAFQTKRKGARRRPTVRYGRIGYAATWSPASSAAMVDSTKASADDSLSTSWPMAISPGSILGNDVRGDASHMPCDTLPSA